MNNFAVHMRISNITVSDDDVNSRRWAATTLGTNWGKQKEVSEILRKVEDVAAALGGEGIPSPTLGDEIQKVIQKKSSSYLYEERPLDIGVCAGMAIVSLLNDNPTADGWITKDVYASALWSTLSYQPVLENGRRENLRREVLDVAREWVFTRAEKSRKRVEVPDPPALSIALKESNLLTNNFREAMAGTIEALRRNAALDREELDFLWWAQLKRSRLLNRQLSAIPEPTRIITAGIEGAKLLRRLPCDVHREIVLRTLDENPELDMAEIMDALGDDRTILGAPFVEGSVVKHPTVFPLLHALATGGRDIMPGATVKRSVSEWGERALLEAGFAKMISQGLSKL